MSDDLGPFAIRRIQADGTSSLPVLAEPAAAQPASLVAKRAAAAYASRAGGDLQPGSTDDALVTQALQSLSGGIGAEALTPLLDSLTAPVPAASLAATPQADGSPASPSTAPAGVGGPSTDALRASVFHPLSDLPAGPIVSAAPGGPASPAVDAGAVGSAFEPLLPVSSNSRT